MSVNFSVDLLARNVAIARELHSDHAESLALIDHYEDFLSTRLDSYPSPDMALRAADEAWARTHSSDVPFCQGANGTCPDTDGWSHVLSVRSFNFYMLGREHREPLGADEYETLCARLEHHPEQVKLELGGDLSSARPVVFLAPRRELEGALSRAGANARADAARRVLGLNKPVHDRLAAIHFPRSALPPDHRLAPPLFVDAGSHCFFVAWSTTAGCGHTWDHGGRLGLREVVSGPLPLGPNIELQYLGDVRTADCADPEYLARLSFDPADHA